MTFLSRESAKARVKSYGTSKNKKVNTDWSSWATVEAGLFDRGKWTAKVITASFQTGQKHPDARGTDQPSSANFSPRLLHLCERGCWTAYQGRIQYQVFDIAPLLRPDSHNVLSFEVAEGWYAGRILWGDGISCFYGSRIGVFAQLDILSGLDARSISSPQFRLVTDETWECQASPIVGSDIYDGETYDMRLDASHWHTADGNWAPVVAFDFPAAQLVASSSPPVRVTEIKKPVKVFTDPNGTALVDFGQNLVGKISIPHLSRPQGHRLRIRHAEVLEHGYLGTRPLRRAKQTDTVIFGDDPLRDWSLHFIYHGFRYVELQGWPAEEMTLDSLVALVMHNDLTRSGHFSCSNEDVNQLHRNVVWSMRGNFVSIPTDCPQRDERLGWTGDLQVFSPTASFLFDCGGMLVNWMRDLLIEQEASGGIAPLVVPNAMKHGPWPAVPQAVWDDIVILLPWTLYTWFGDAGVLAEAYAGMQAYLRTLQRSEDGLWDPALWQLGDWLDPNAPPAEPGLATTDGVLVADAYLVRVTGLMVKIAKVLDRTEDEREYAAEAERLRDLLRDKYITKSGFIVADSQTSMALALLFGIVEDQAQKKALADRLARLVRYSKFRVSTGFAGTPAILHALSEAGHVDLAYRMLLETGCPSWLYPVKMGATTIWERWDSMLEDGSINPGQMTSFNHYALGSVAEWIHANIGGVEPLLPGWKNFRVRPRPGGDITNAKLEFLCPHGQTKVSWELESGKHFSLNISVPPNSTAVVQLPDGSEAQNFDVGEYSIQCRISRGKEWPPSPLLTQFGDHKGYEAKYE
ncbi:Alpha-L-rhamnosidase [Paramyrothecium foliicola]|nr:Alpha-L-rhamnosidase [Paramyrothecium foliicola]